MASGSLRPGIAIVALALLAGCTAPTSPSSRPANQSTAPVPATTASDSTRTPAQPTASSPTGCAGAATVQTADELIQALAAAQSGTVIRLAPGRYQGRFAATAKGTASQPIRLCGPVDAVLDAGGVRGGYGLHLNGATHWVLSGFSVTNAQKGVMLDGTQHTVIDGLTVHTIGDEAIHLRTNSSDNTVRNSTIYATGKRREKFGEGIYIGSAVSNWQLTNGQPDRSDNNLIENNTIRDTTAEAIDAKEGTTGGRVIGNSFDGAALTGADSWVDIKGNGWTIEANRGLNSPFDGYQTHEILSGWGRDNAFRRNTAGRIATEDPAGVGFGFRPKLNNIATCDNTVEGTFGTVECTP